MGFENEGKQLAFDIAEEERRRQLKAHGGNGAGQSNRLKNLFVL